MSFLAELKKIIPDAEEKLKHLYQEEADREAMWSCTAHHGALTAAKRANGWRRTISPITEVDISTNLNAARQVRAWGDGYQITPTFDIDGEIVLDFDETKLRNCCCKANQIITKRLRVKIAESFFGHYFINHPAGAFRLPARADGSGPAILPMCLYNVPFASCMAKYSNMDEHAVHLDPEFSSYRACRL